MKPISGKRMCRILEKHGWSLVRKRGSHRAYQKPGSKATVIVPVHGSKDLKPGTSEEHHAGCRADGSGCRAFCLALGCGRRGKSGATNHAPPDIIRGHSRYSGSRSLAGDN